MYIVEMKFLLVVIFVVLSIRFVLITFIKINK